MKNIFVKTGFGYFKDANGDIISKAELPIGVHPIRNNITYIEVTNKTELDKIVVPVAEKDIVNTKISKTQRNLAIRELKNISEIPQDYPEEII